VTGIGAGVTGLVLVAAVLHASWNAILKGSRGKLLSLATMIAAGGGVCLLLIPFVPLPASDAWIFLGLSTVLHVGYYLFLIGSYRVGDLSHVYPIARGFGPLLVALLSPILIEERLTVGELAAVATISAGIASLAWVSGARANPRSFSVPTFFALGTGVFIAAYTIVDGLGVRAAGRPLSYILWMNALEGTPLFVYVLATRFREFRKFAAGEGRLAAGAGVMAAVAYGLVIWAFSLGAIAPIAALRETSVIFAAWIGARLLGEPFGRRRILAATIVAIGILLLHTV
jgi:drug/metabolite transporter (DMT)-like permease